MNKTILAIDDEVNILTLLQINLELDRFNVITGSTGIEALELAESKLPDLILLDLMLPDIDGIEVCKRLKMNVRTQHIPIIMLTAKVLETDKVIGLEMGADYYLTKPFGIRELIAVIRAVLRRSTTQSTETTVLKIDDLLIDEQRMRVTKLDEEIELTRMEFKLLVFLAKNRETVLERKVLVDALTEKESIPDARSIDVHIWNLRKKLKQVPPENDYIETIRGVGYRFK